MNFAEQQYPKGLNPSSQVVVRSNCVPDFRAGVLPWCALLGLVAVMVVARGFSVAEEDLQALCFPAFLFCFWLLFRSLLAGFSSPRLRRGLVLIFVVLLGTWLFFTLRIRGMVIDLFLPRAIYLSRIPGDDSGLGARRILREYTRLVGRYPEFPDLYLLQREFSGDAAVGSWFSGRSRPLMVLRGTKDWLSVVPVSEPASFVRYDQQLAVDPELKEAVQTGEALARQFGVSVGEGSRLVLTANHALPFLLVSTPERFSLPVDPIELSSYFLGWLAKGLRGKAGSEDAFSEAADIHGHWKSSIPRGAARFYWGTEQLLQYLQQFSNGNRDGAAAQGVAIEDGLRQCAENTLGSAIAILQRRFAVDVRSAALNNLAIAALADPNVRRGQKRAVQLLELAVSDVVEAGPTIGSRAAFVNLILLRESGAL